jgi:hypothetical protein
MSLRIFLVVSQQLDCAVVCAGSRGAAVGLARFRGPVEVFGFDQLTAPDLIGYLQRPPLDLIASMRSQAGQGPGVAP